MPLRFKPQDTFQEEVEKRIKKARLSQPFSHCGLGVINLKYTNETSLNYPTEVITLVCALRKSIPFGKQPPYFFLVKSLKNPNLSKSYHPIDVLSPVKALFIPLINEPKTHATPTRFPAPYIPLTAS